LENLGEEMETDLIDLSDTENDAGKNKFSLERSSEIVEIGSYVHVAVECFWDIGRYSLSRSYCLAD
jgi:hypothetical protein